MADPYSEDFEEQLDTEIALAQDVQRKKEAANVIAIAAPRRNQTTFSITRPSDIIVSAPPAPVFSEDGTNETATLQRCSRQKRVTGSR